MLTAALWGLLQGLTEFLPISSSGHLVLVPALLGVEEPDLATSAVLHLGTLVAVIVFYRRDLRRLVTEPGTVESRHIWTLLIIGTIPAALIGLLFHERIANIFTEPRAVAALLVGTGVVLLATRWLRRGGGTLPDAGATDAAAVGVAQAAALLPGFSRSGFTIAAGVATGLSRVEATRFAFLLAVPAIAGAGLLEMVDLVRQGGFEATVLVGAGVAAISGYAAISFLVRLIGRWGLVPFAVYCLGFGAFAYAVV